MRKLIVLVAVLAVVVTGTYVAAGRAAGPVIVIVKPDKFVGTVTPVEVVISAPGAGPEAYNISFEQGGTRTGLFWFSPDGPRAQGADFQKVTPEGPGRLRIACQINKTFVPGLHSGPARIVVTASRAVLGGIRNIQTESARDVVVNLEPPQVSIISTHNYVNLGGAEMVVYRATPAGSSPA